MIMTRRQSLAAASVTRRQALAAVCALPSVACAQGQWSLPKMPDVVLKDQDGATWNLQSDLAAHRPVVLSFMFTTCAATCPPQTAVLHALRRALDTDAALSHVLLLSITVDPMGDGPEQLSAYAKRYGITPGRERGWLFLTGERPALAKAWRAFGVDAGDRDAHPSLLWVGHAARNRWTRSSAMNPLRDLLRAVREVAG